MKTKVNFTIDWADVGMIVFIVWLCLGTIISFKNETKIKNLERGHQELIVEAQRISQEVYELKFLRGLK